MFGKKICSLCWGPEADTNLQSHFKLCNGNSITGEINRSCSLSMRKRISVSHVNFWPPPLSSFLFFLACILLCSSALRPLCSGEWFDFFKLLSWKYLLEFDFTSLELVFAARVQHDKAHHFEALPDWQSIWPPFLSLQWAHTMEAPCYLFGLSLTGPLGRSLHSLEGAVSYSFCKCMKQFKGPVCRI